MEQDLGQQFFIALAILTSIGIVMEYAYASYRGKTWYNFSDFLTNMLISSGHLYWGLITTPFIFGGFELIHQGWGFQRLQESLGTASYYILGYVLAEFTQYWGHRFSHRQNFLIAGHIVHHSSQRFNLSTGLRVSWVYRAYIWVMYIPMALLGYNAIDFMIILLVMNGYNFFMHTRVKVNYGPFRYLFVTPDHHRLHHCSNDEYYGKNFGASLIIFDRMFGTCVEPKEAIKESYGLKNNIESTDPVLINFHYFQEVFKLAKSEKENFLTTFLRKAGKHPRLTYIKSIFQPSFKMGFFVLYIALVAIGLGIGSYKSQIHIGMKVLVIVIFSFVISQIGKRVGSA